MRDINGLTGNVILPAFLCELDLGMHIIQAWSGRGELEWKGRRFGNVKAISQIIGGVSNVDESGEAKATGLTYFVSGIDPESNEGRELITIVQSQIKRGGVCNLWFATMEEFTTITVTFGPYNASWYNASWYNASWYNGGVASSPTISTVNRLSGEPFLIASTLVDAPLVQIRKDGITILLQTETRRVRHRARRGRRTTFEDHQLDHPGDRFYEFKNALQDRTI